MLLSFAGNAPRMSSDTYYHFHTNRNFLYLTGITESQGFILLVKKAEGKTEEIIFALPKDEMAERWNGKRHSFAEISEISGISDVRPLSDFEDIFHKAAISGEFSALALDLYQYKPGEPELEPQRFARHTAKQYPQLRVTDYQSQLRTLRTIKKPCEIDAMKEAMKATRAGILAMMKATKPGIYEYELLAEFFYACTKMGVLIPSSQPIIAAGKNNFCIHYYGYTGKARADDMILIDSGAYWDNQWNDVSRAWPASGKFNERQRLLYQCAYNTSQYMFDLIKPGMPMADVDRTIRRHCCEQLKVLGLVDSYEEAGKLMWHGGAHHVGYDVHDAVDTERDSEKPISPGMVFCVDIGIYCEEWGIGFRLEDNCLVTEDGCINLSADIPRSIEDIEEVFS